MLTSNKLKGVIMVSRARLILILLIMAGVQMVQAQERPSIRDGIPIQGRAGSAYWTDGQEFRIKSGSVLPIGIAIKNNQMPKKIILNLHQSNSNFCPATPNGFTNLGKNPTSPVGFLQNERKIIWLNIKISTQNKQILLVDIQDEVGGVLETLYLTINEPRFASLPYRPFDESSLCDFSMPPGALGADRGKKHK